MKKRGLVGRFESLESGRLRQVPEVELSEIQQPTSKQVDANIKTNSCQQPQDARASESSTSEEVV